MQLPDADTLIATLADTMRPHMTPKTALVGIHTGGVWLAQRLHSLLGLAQPLGSVDVSFYRDDYNSKGLPPSPKKSTIPFDIEGAHIVIVDDVLFTGRTTRAAMNELFDYGRPAQIDLAVLVDRGGRQLPIAARFCALTLPEPLPAGQSLCLEQDDTGALSMRLIHD